MGYRIFYSYQSDIDENLNKKFIRNAIETAIQNISEYEIEPLIEGFYGRGGNPPLAETMLKQSKEADIFIGDVTFTMSKVWNNPIEKHIGENSVILEIPKGDMKPAPNPNVLLETGYSWALKNYERTILVFNKAFGDPANLPVDMSGLRWPITYNLSHERAEKGNKYQKEKTNLIKSLESAIIDAIKSDISYQTEKFKPFKIYSDWGRVHIYPYKITPSLDGKIKNLKNLLQDYKGPIRLSGLAETGKTRLIYETFRLNEELITSHFSILYYDLLGTSYGDISKQIADVIAINQAKVIIVDNCNLEIHNRLKQEFRNTLIKLITIVTVKSTREKESANIFLEEELALEVNQLILNEKLSSLGISISIDQVGHSVTKTVTFFENDLRGELEDKTSIELISLIIGDEYINKGALDVLKAISLFGHVGFLNSYNYQINAIHAALLSGITTEQITDNIQMLLSKKLLSAKGDFVIISIFKDELLNDWWGNNKGSINDIVEKLISGNMLTNFVSRLIEGEIEISEVFFSEEGIFTNNKISDEEVESELLNMFADSHPEEVLDVITKRIL